MNSNKFMAITSLIIIIIGGGMVTGGGWIFAQTSMFFAKSVPADGHVVNLVSRENDHHIVWYPVIEFTTRDNRTIRFESNSGSNPPMYGNGQDVRIIYLPEQPDKARINSTMEMWFTPALLLTFGGLFSIAGIGIGYVIAAKKKKDEWLAAHGALLRTEIKHIGPDTSMSVKSTHPYRIISQYRDDVKHKVYIFESDPIWFDPSEFIEDNHINVLVDPANYNRYCVDLSFLPKREGYPN